MNAKVFTIALAIISILVASGADYLVHDYANIDRSMESIDNLDDFLDTRSDRRYVLECDIDLTWVAWETKSSIAYLDGNGHTIKGADKPIFSDLSGDVLNLRLVDVNITGANVAALATRSEGRIENITVSGTIESTDGTNGGVVGEAYGEVRGCTSSVTITGSGRIGGIAGYSDLLIADCSNTGNITSTYQHAGGICGWSQGDIKDCQNSGNITAKAFVGGICGNCTTAQGCSNSGNIVSTSVSENMETNGSLAGGIAGWINWVSDCTNTGNVTAQYSSYFVGGIAGYAWMESEFNNLSNSGTITSQCNCTGGIIGKLGTQLSQDVTISNIRNEGNVVSSKDYHGGLFGNVETYGYKVTVTEWADPCSPHVGGGSGYVLS